jgi:hypothetical protein
MAERLRNDAADEIFRTALRVGHVDARQSAALIFLQRSEYRQARPSRGHAGLDDVVRLEMKHEMVEHVDVRGAAQAVAASAKFRLRRIPQPWMPIRERSHPDRGVECDERLFEGLGVLHAPFRASASVRGLLLGGLPCADAEADNSSYKLAI